MQRLVTLQCQAELTAGVGQEPGTPALGEQLRLAGVLVGDVPHVPGGPVTTERAADPAQSPTEVLGIEVVRTGGGCGRQGRERTTGQVGADDDLRQQLSGHRVHQHDQPGVVGGQHRLTEPVEELTGEVGVHG
ncbi:hypothetical protein [Verrucosispora sioxanthis]|uniref:hypothetical protein n=1 Tax=Verrucosispora sioxanthis TaxID=2499994 RepID=UPI0020A1C0D3|nr:hypothetical protein [Verrucosispora sioxanthis]